MPATKEEVLLKEIRDLLKDQQKTLADIKAARGGGYFGHLHWKFLIVMTVVTLIAGGFGAYQYYKILQSIIDQYPS